MALAAVVQESGIAGRDQQRRREADDEMASDLAQQVQWLQASRPGMADAAAWRRVLEGYL